MSNDDFVYEWLLLFSFIAWHLFSISHLSFHELQRQRQVEAKPFN